MAAYARNELGFKTEMTYPLLANDVTGHWDWQGGRLQAGAEDDLRALLAFDPSFRLLIAHGIFRHGHALRHDALRARPPAAGRRPAARSSSSIAAGTWFISTRSRARRSAPTPRRFTGARNNYAVPLNSSMSNPTSRSTT